jgi:hypothetical protein
MRVSEPFDRQLRATIRGAMTAGRTAPQRCAVAGRDARIWCTARPARVATDVVTECNPLIRIRLSPRAQRVQSVVGTYVHTQGALRHETAFCHLHRDTGGHRCVVN